MDEYRKVHANEDTHRKLKIGAALTGKSMAQIIAELVDEWFGRLTTDTADHNYHGEDIA